MSQKSRAMGVLISVRFLLIGFTAHLALGASTTSISNSLGTYPSTCPSRTVNYITHGLPQQCLASSRSSSANVTTPTSQTDSNATSSLEQSTQQDESQKQFLKFSPTGPTESSKSSTEINQTEDNGVVPTAVSGQKSHTPSSSAPVSSVSATAVVVDDSSAESLLGDANFLSFEDWKKQNLLKAGQSEHVGAGRQSEQREHKKGTINVHQALDSLGDDTEIDLDFTGFVADRPELAVPSSLARNGEDSTDSEEKTHLAAPLARLSSKDAGKTYKERYNYASFDCAATVLKTNAKAKGAHYVLSENKDSYMLNECSANNKFLILELCNDISIDTIVVANFEFFSSIFRTFRVSVSDKYPVKADKWKVLGEFEARNSRDIQAFLVTNPMIWARYLQIEFLTHYGSEFYCPISLVRIHGTTMLEEYKHEFDPGMAEEEGELAEPVEKGEALQPEAIAEALVEEGKKIEQEQEHVTCESEEDQAAEDLATSNAPKLTEQQDSQPDSFASCASNLTSLSANASLIFEAVHEYCPINQTRSTAGGSTAAAFKSSQSSSTSSTLVTTTLMAPGSQSLSSMVSESSMSNTVKASAKSSKETQLTASSNKTSTAVANATSVSNKDLNSTASEKSKQSTTSTQPQPASPTIQESFFKSVQKRLQMLESNSSLSLQYIEEQSRALRDAFGRVEQRQMTKTTAFLEYLNITVLNELRDFRQQYDQLWQSTVIELESQRQQYQQETLEINTRLGILADEVIFQKRMSILQMVLILVCLGLVLFSRGAMHNYMELPMVQNMLARSPSSKWMSMSALETPSTSPPVTRPNSSHKLKPSSSILKRRLRQGSDESISSVIHNQEDFSPLTPISNDGHSEIGEQQNEAIRPESPRYDPSEIVRPSTSPPVLARGEGNATPEFVVLRDDESIERLLSSPIAAPTSRRGDLPEFSIRPATPPQKHLTFQLPDG